MDHYLDAISYPTSQWDDELVRRNRFTIIHQTVFDLSPIDLRAQLQTSTTEIEVPCSRGRTSLHWAAQQSKTEVMETLIEFGGSLHLQDRHGNMPLYYVAAFGTIEALRVLLTNIGSGRYRTPKTQPTSYASYTTFHAPDSANHFLKFCLDSATLSNYGYLALGGCVYFSNRSEFARMLLDAGASGYGCSIFTFRGADFTEHKDAFNRTPLEDFDKVRPQYKSNEPMTQKCR